MMKLLSLEGLPKSFNSWIDCSFNELVSLEGLPEGFDSEIICSNNKLVSLEGITALLIHNLITDFSEKEIIREYSKLGLFEYIV